MLKKTAGIVAWTLLVSTFVMGQGTLHVTIYNDNIALVNEKRQMQLSSGAQLVEVTDVAATIIPASVLIQPQHAGDLDILEQNFEYDLVDANTIFSKYIDQKIRVNTEHESEFEATLMSTMGNKYVFKLADGQIKIIDPKEILSTSFPNLPKGLRTRPTLVWSLDNSGSNQQDIDISYLARNMSWQAEYVGKLAEDNNSLHFTGWVSIENNAGKTFENAILKLVAGDVNIVRDDSDRFAAPMMEMAVTRKSRPQFKEKSFFEYHLYTLERPATLKDKQTKQIQFIAPSKVKSEKEFVYDHTRSDGVQVFVKFKNNKENGLGLPLPKGTVRVYQSDTDDAQVFLGEDRIDHTPKNEDVRLKIGEAFDIVAERREINNVKTGSNRRELTFEVTVRNHKEENIKITVIDRFRGDWRVKATNLGPKEKTAEQVEWNIAIPKDGEYTLTYTIEQRW